MFQLCVLQALSLPGTACELCPSWGVKGQTSSKPVSGTWRRKNNQSSCRPSCQLDTERGRYESVIQPFDQAHGQSDRETNGHSVSQSDRQTDISQIQQTPSRQVDKQAVNPLASQTWRQPARQADQEMKKYTWSYI